MKGDWLRAKALQIKEAWETSEPTIPNGLTFTSNKCPNPSERHPCKQHQTGW